jgi:hypothetical protein
MSKKQRFFVLESPHINLRLVFEVYETIDRVVILTTNSYDAQKEDSGHNYSTHTIAKAREIWQSYTRDRSQEFVFIRNIEMEKELNASR